MSVKSFLSRLFGFGSATSTEGGLRVHPDQVAMNDEVLRLLPLGARRTVRYPPFVEGYPATISSDYLLSLQDELYYKMAGQIGMERSEFNRLIRPVILNYVKFVHLLPASENHHHSGPGGLLRHGLEVAYYTMNGTKNKAFDSRKTPAERSKRNDRWPAAGLITGLLHDAGKAVTDMHVVYHPDDLRWIDSHGSIEDWTREHRLDKYFIEWQKGRHGRHMAMSRDLVRTLCPPETIGWLREGGDDIYYAILNAITGDEASPLYGPLIDADGKSTQRDMATGESPLYQTGVPVMKLLLNAMNRLIQEETWTVNQPGSRVWTTTQGVFIAWSSGAKEIVDLILADKIESIPRTPASLLMRLVDEGVGEKHPSGELYWEVAPDSIQKSADKPLVLRCMKMASADTLFPFSGVPAPTSVRIKHDGQLVAYPAPSEAVAAPTAPAPASQASEVIPDSDNTAESADAAVKTTTTPHQGEAGRKAATKANGKQSTPKLALVTTDRPVLVEAPKEPSSNTAQKPDPVLDRLANVEVGSFDEAGRQGFLEEALQCFNQTDSTDATQPSAPGADQAAAKSAPLTLKTADKHQVSSKPEQKTADNKSSKLLTLNDILQGGPKPSSKKPNKKKKSQAQQASTATDNPPNAPPPAVPDPVDALTQQLDNWALTPEEKNTLGQHPELASAVLTALNHPDIFSAYLNRVFLPTNLIEGGVDPRLIPALEEEGWLWHDFTIATEGSTYIVSKREGVVLASWLCTLVLRNIHRELTGMAAWARRIDPDQQSEEVAQKLVELARPITLPNGVEVLNATIVRISQATKALGLTVEEGFEALHLHRNAVLDHRGKRVLILPLDGELKSRGKN